jgi:hypothetical protein
MRNHPSGFDAKPSTLVLRLNQETRHDRPATEYPTCATILGPLHQVSYSCHDPHRCTRMPHLPPAHHETSKHDSQNETKIKEKQNETVPDSNSNLAKSMTHHNQTK